MILGLSFRESGQLDWILDKDVLCGVPRELP